MGITYDRAIELLKNTIDYSLLDRCSEEAKEDLNYIGFTDEELCELGYRNYFFVYDIDKLFCSFLSTIDFMLVKYKDGFGIVDKQGANFGDIESDRFKNAEQIFDRLDVYINDAYINTLAEDFEAEGIEVTWKQTCEEYAKRRNMLPIKYSFEFDVLDMICYHANDIDLNNCYVMEEE